MKVRKKNPCYEAVQLTVDNVEEVYEKIRDCLPPLWGPRADDGSPQPHLRIDGSRNGNWRVNCGDWIIVDTSYIAQWLVVEVVPDEIFQTEYKKVKNGE